MERKKQYIKASSWRIDTDICMLGRKTEWLLGLIVLVLIALLANAGFLSPDSAEGAQKAEEKEQTIVIDAGHGGVDPGKVGVNDQQEKDINLKIAQYLQAYLEDKGVCVVMTREEDEGLYSASSSNKKTEDLQNRCELIEEVNPAAAVSIHQNSFHDSSVSGCQVFYYSGSMQGEVLAEAIQSSMIELLEPEKERTVKANDSYYLLLHTDVPTVIVECGFLSNYSEAEKLSEKAYQKQVAKAVGEGILEYLNEEGAGRKE